MASQLGAGDWRAGQAPIHVCVGARAAITRAVMIIVVAVARITRWPASKLIRCAMLAQGVVVVVFVRNGRVAPLWARA